MVEIVLSKEYFNITDTLTCGQIFRFSEYNGGYAVFSCDKLCFLFERGDNVVIQTKEEDENYFKTFFDLDRDYKEIVNSALNGEYQMLSVSAEVGKGIRILKQDETETLFSFMISQNNNIKRIKLIIDRLCTALGEEKEFNGVKYHAFPKVEVMAKKDEEFYKSIGLGYRAEYIRRLAVDINNGFDILGYSNLTTPELKKALCKIYGVGEKVADCVSLFGFNRFDSFPVDTWIEKVYKDYFNGTLTDRKKITEWFISKFKNNSGIYQQYLFHYKRNIEKK